MNKHESYWTIGWGVVGQFLRGVERDAERLGCKLEIDPPFPKFGFEHHMIIRAEGGDIDKFNECMKARKP